MSTEILIGGNGKTQAKLAGRMANRHGLIAGATGTGKTVTLQVLAEGFSRAGVPVFMADVKGDLSGLAQTGTMNDKIKTRIESIGIQGYSSAPNPVLCWDLFGKLGHPIRTTISDMGPLLLSNLLELNDIQTGVLYSAFAVADDNGMLLLDLKDLRAMLNWVGEHAQELGTKYGNIAPASIGAIQRSLLVLEEQGAEHFFGEPALSLQDLMITDFSGHGVISIMDVTEVMSKSPRLYATFLLWLLAELFEQMPEVGDADKPKLVLFFDEAHLLFDRAPQSLLDKIEQVVRLIRSKGVGVYFISQSPLDIPTDILGQLGARVQHALRAFTPKDQKAVQTAAETFRPNPEIDTATVITELGTGEALVSTLDEKGAPSPVERVFICPPGSRIGPLTDGERSELLGRSPIKGRYDTAQDRESAYELLQKRIEEESRVKAEEQARVVAEKQQAKEERESQRGTGRQTVTEAILKSVARSVSSSIGQQIGRQIIRGVLGSLLK
ncbi:MAG: ATP-binding protein [Gammaproteobacteria bacterium RIFOXYD12_FULL_61_37]|nr:MAG: ATP-binding protein [Gammaproteobacteria bacterium RIFOXYD12_FULL_61_37]